MPWRRASPSPLWQTFRDGVTKDLAWRKGQISAVRTMVEENKESIVEALDKDVGGGPVRGLFEFGGSHTGLSKLAHTHPDVAVH